MVGCSFARLCSTLSELCDLGFLQREKLGRHTVYRVIYTDEDRLLFGNTSGRSIGCRSGNETGITGCQHSSRNGAKPPETASQYIPLNGGIDSDESGEKNSSEEARFARGSAGRVAFDDNAGAQMSRFERQWKESPYSFDIDSLQKWSDYCFQVQEAHEVGDPEFGQAQRLGTEIEMTIDELRSGGY